MYSGPICRNQTRIRIAPTVGRHDGYFQFSLCYDDRSPICLSYFKALDASHLNPSNKTKGKNLSDTLEEKYWRIEKSRSEWNKNIWTEKKSKKKTRVSKRVTI